MLKSASAVSVNKFQLFTEKENIRKGGTLIHAYPLFLAQCLICEMEKQRYYLLAAEGSAAFGREWHYLRPRVALLAAANR